MEELVIEFFEGIDSIQSVDLGMLKDMG